MLAEGGVLDQPVIWLACKYAGSIWEVLRKAKRSKNAIKELDANEHEIYKKYLRVVTEKPDQPPKLEADDHDPNW
jgi:hypothetical protein